MKNDTHLNVLASYAYLHGSDKMLETIKRETTRGHINLMIDSGAFTKFNAKSSSMCHVNVRDYSEFLFEMKDYSEKYVMLDVVGNDVQSKANYEQMVDCGLNPMYVATMFDNDFQYINDAVSRNADICVAGGVTTKGPWVIKRYQDIYRKTGGRARIHGLGYFTFPKMLQLPLASVDASSWHTAPVRFGQLIYFDGKKTRRILWRDFLNGKERLEPKMKMLLDAHGITPKMFCDKKNHMCHDNIEAFLSIVCAIKLQKYCKNRGLDYFVALGEYKVLSTYLFVSENIEDVTYEEFLKVCRS